MKQFVAILALLGALAAPALASVGGISGRIVDEKSGKALSGVPLEIYRMPVRRGDRAVATLRSDRRGFFAEAALVPGRYLVAALADGRSFGCVVDDVFDNTMTRFTLGVGEENTVCSGPRVHPGLVNADITADLTIIR